MKKEKTEERTEPEFTRKIQGYYLFFPLIRHFGGRIKTKEYERTIGMRNEETEERKQEKNE